MPQRQDPAIEAPSRLRMPRVAVNMELPLYAVVGVAATIAWGAISMYFQLKSVVESMAEVKTSIKESREAATLLIGDLTALKGRQGLLEYRVDKLESKEARK